MDNRQIRARMRELLPTDADLEAFCLDYFPSVKREFGAGMLRTQKESLLLEKADRAELEQRLSECQTPTRTTTPNSPSGVAESTGVAALYEQLVRTCDLHTEFLNSDIARLVAEAHFGRPREGVKEIAVGILDKAAAVSAAHEALLTLVNKTGFYLSADDSEVLRGFVARLKGNLESLSSALLLLRSNKNEPVTAGLLIMQNNLVQMRPEVELLARTRHDIERRLRESRAR